MKRRGFNSSVRGFAPTHGMKGSPEYNSWRAMHRRCKVQKGYRDRVTVCARWRDSFETFFADMGPKPTPAHSLERKNNEIGYEPENCVWATALEQRLNQSRVHPMTFRGETMVISEWAKRLGVTRSSLSARLRRGWTDEEALSTPFRAAR